MPSIFSSLPRSELETLIRAIPKTDLHVHLDGSIRLQTLIDLAQQQGIALPSDTVEGLQQTLFKDSYDSLEEYLKTFGYSCAVMQDPASLTRIAYELAIDNQQEGVRYLEVRFAPQLHINANMDMETVLLAVNKGLQQAAQEFNGQPAVARGDEPKFIYGIIVCALRAFEGYSDYYRNFIAALTFSDKKTIASLGSLELAKGAIQIRDQHQLPIVALDLAGAEHGNPAKDHWRAFQHAHEHFLAKTVHAGEAYGPTSIFQALTDLHADRIGHGFFLFDESKVDDPIDNKKQFIKDLSEYIAEHRVTIEVCLTSNLQTNPQLGHLAHHSLKTMMEHDLSVTICTDNRTVSKTTVTNEIMLALEHFDIDAKRLKNIIAYGFKRSFFPGSYSEKRQYVRSILRHYEQLTQGSVLYHPN